MVTSESRETLTQCEAIVGGGALKTIFPNLASAFFPLLPGKKSFVSSLSTFLPDDGQCAFVSENGVIEKHVARHIVDVASFANAVRVMFRPDESDRDRSKSAVALVHEMMGAGLRDELCHLDTSCICGIDYRRASLDQGKQTF